MVLAAQRVAEMNFYVQFLLGDVFFDVSSRMSEADHSAQSVT